MDDQRRYARVPVAWPVRLWTDEESVIGRAHDASTHGLGVTLAPTAAVKRGQSYWIDFITNDAGPVAMAAVVRYVSGRRIGLEVKRPLLMTEVRRAAG